MMRIYKTDIETGKLNSLEKLEENAWIHMINPSEEEIKEITSKTGIDKSLFVKLLDEEELSRIEVEGDDTLIVVDIPALVDSSHKNKYRTLPLGIIHTTNYIVTVMLKENKLFDDFETGHVKDFCTEKKTRFTIQLFLRISQGYLRALNEMNKDIQREERILAQATKNQELLEMLNIEKSLVYFMGALKYNKNTLDKLAKGTILPFYEEDLELLEDAMIECNQAIEMANIYKEIMASTTETYASVISNNLNGLMKFLSGITIVFSIPTMIASFMGMNVPLGIFSTNPFAFWILIVISITLALLIAYWLKKKNML